MIETLASVIASLGAGVAMLAVAAGLRQLIRRRAQRTVPLPTGGFEYRGTASREEPTTEENRRLYAAALEEKRHGKYEEAVRLLRGILSWDSSPSDRIAALMELGSCFRAMGRLAEAEGHYREAEALAHQHGSQRQVGDAHTQLGNVYAQRGDYEQADRQLHSALAIHQVIADEVGEAQALTGLGIVAAERNDFPTAADYFSRALQKYGADELGGANVASNLAVAFANLGQLDEAQDYLERALKTHEDMGVRERVATDLTNMGNISARRGSYDEAESHYRKALAIHSELGNTLGQANAIGNLAGLYEGRGYLREARSHYRTAIDLFEQAGAVARASRTKERLDQLDTSTGRSSQAASPSEAQDNHEA